MRPCLPLTRCGKLSSCSSRLPALARTAWSCLLSRRSSICCTSCAKSILLCQISSGGRLARARMRVRYASTDATAAARARLFEKPAARVATATLAANRLRSTVKSMPGRVSSKSFMSKRMLSSGVANAPKFIKWQSPQACTTTPGDGWCFRSSPITAAAPRKNAKGLASIRS
jgi:hypothetical protein